jgi:hypothetical protein
MNWKTVEWFLPGMAVLLARRLRAERKWGHLARFTPAYPVLSGLELAQLKQRKIELIRDIGRGESIRDYGGIYGVHGLYLLEGARALGCKSVEMIDVTENEEDLQAFRRLQEQMEIRVDYRRGDFRDADLFKTLAPVDVSLLYDVLLHQDNAEEVMRNVLTRTTRYVCLAQPVLKEELFRLPGGCVNLQFYPEDLKDMLRAGSFWPKEPRVETFSAWYWMWGQTISYFVSVLQGYGWSAEFINCHYMSLYWNYALIRARPTHSAASPTLVH